MIAARHCSKPGCSRPAVATLTYDYRDSTAVLGPLATAAEPHAYDLCEVHADGLTAPQGWQVVRLQTHFDPAPPSDDDLLALVDAVRDAARAPRPTSEQVSAHSSWGAALAGAREPLAAELGPFARAPQQEEKTDNPLDPASPFAQRRAQFRIVEGEADTEE